MALPTATFDTYAAKGIREDLEDVIYRLDPMDTPFLSQAGKTKATAVLHEWQIDTLAAAGANKAIEGNDATATTVSATTRYSNKCQISTKIISITGTQRAVDTAGRDDELSYQLAKKGKELKRDMEYALTTNQGIATGSSLTARSMGSVESWIFIGGNVTKSTGTTTPAYSSGALAGPTDGTTTSWLTFTEARLKTSIQQCWTAGGDPGVVLVGPVNKAKASAFTGIATQYKQNTGMQRATILGAADWYVSNFGEHRIVPSRFSRERVALILDMEYWAVATLRPMQTIELAKTGDSDRRELLVEYTLVARNPAASAKIACITIT